MKKISKIYRFIYHYIYSLKLKLSFRIVKNLFVLPRELRSDSEEDIYYINAIKKSVSNKREFDNFKRNKSIQSIIETVSENLGLDYLTIIESRNDEILNKGLSSVLVSDIVGNPIKYKYSGYSYPLSPTTLRYLKVTSDINFLFGNEFKKVAEIGCGYGGQTLVNDQLLNIKSAKLFDLPYVNKLIKRYLNSNLLNGSFKVTTINEEKAEEYDLVISNYAFSELPAVLQKKYIEKVLSKSKRGYLTMNSGYGKSCKRSLNKMSIQEIRDLLPNTQVLKEEPLTDKFNYIIIWGNDNVNLKDFFEFKPLEVK